MMNSIFSAWLIWFILGIGLAFLELQLPGFVVLFMGLGCLIVAGVLLIWPLTVAQQIMLFVVASIASIVLLRRWLMRIFKGAASTQPKEGFDDFPKGVHVKVVQRISPLAKGRIQHRGTLWDAVADEEIEAGETAEIVRYADNSSQIYFVKKL